MVDTYIFNVKNSLNFIRFLDEDCILIQNNKERHYNCKNCELLKECIKKNKKDYSIPNFTVKCYSCGKINEIYGISKEDYIRIYGQIDNCEFCGELFNLTS